MSKLKPAPYRKQSVINENINNSWGDHTPFEPGYIPLLGEPGVGHNVKTCPVNSAGKTIFLPEWYHGTI